MKTKLVLSTEKIKTEQWTDLPFLPRMDDWFNVKDILTSMKKIIGFPLAIFALLVINSCSDMIEYSPYDIDIIGETINLINIDLISNKSDKEDTLRFALISDPHTHYDDLDDAIKCLNNLEGLQFVACCGDITDCGLSQEFNWYQNVISGSKYPVITVIGNHDYRSNGHEIYKRMFGPVNMTFHCMGHDFIIFDDIVWENNNSTPDFEWLRNRVNNSNDPTILLTHIPPWTDQIEGTNRETYGDIIGNSNVMLCLHGHEHIYYQNSFAGIPAIVSGSVDKRSLSIIKVYGTDFKIERFIF